MALVVSEVFGWIGTMFRRLPRDTEELRRTRDPKDLIADVILWLITLLLLVIVGRVLWQLGGTVWRGVSAIRRSF
jgi:hypothetical protein